MFAEKTTLKSFSSSEETLQVVPRVVLARSRGRPRKHPTAIVSVMTKRKPPVSRLIMLPTINIQNDAESSGSGTVKKSPVVVRKPPAVLGKTSVLLEKPHAVVVTRSPTVSLARPVSTASRVVVINTSSAAVTKTQPTQTTGSNSAVKSVITQATSEKTGLLATITATSNSGSSRPTVVIIRSSASSSSSSNTDTKSTPAAGTVLKKSSGSVLMSMKKVVPVTYAIMKHESSATSTQRKLAPLIKFPPYKRGSHEGSNVAVLPEKTSSMLQDGWKPPTTNTRYHTTHTC